MTQDQYKSDLTFYVKNAKLDQTDFTEDKPEVGRIELEQDDSDAKVFLYPRTTKTVEGKIDGMDAKNTETAKYTVKELPEWIKKMVKTTLDSNQVFEIHSTAQKVTYDDGNNVFRIYQDMMDADNFRVEVVEKMGSEDIENDDDVQKLEDGEDQGEDVDEDGSKTIFDGSDEDE